MAYRYTDPLDAESQQPSGRAQAPPYQASVTPAPEGPRYGAAPAGPTPRRNTPFQAARDFGPARAGAGGAQHGDPYNTQMGAGYGDDMGMEPLSNNYSRSASGGAVYDPYAPDQQAAEPQQQYYVGGGHSHEPNYGAGASFYPAAPAPEHHHTPYDQNDPGADPFQEDLDTPLLAIPHDDSHRSNLRGARPDFASGYPAAPSGVYGMPGSYRDGSDGSGNGRDADAESMVRYGKIPQRQPRRYKTVKRVNLYHGNLVLDCEVPSKLLESCPKKDDREFTHMRYTAATCDPNDFFEERYSLRQVLYDPPRRTELFIVLTMYNEDEVLFCRTMHGVMKNVQHLASRTRSKTWGAEGWKKVVVCIVSDGRKKISSRTLSVLAAMGVYQDGVAKNVVAGKPVTAHIYEYTTQISIDPDLKFKTAERGLVPVQMIFCLKEKNAKKINSHRWFFNAFGPVLQPNICVLLDVGTQPGPTSIYKLWKTFDLNSNVGGACGEIVALKGKYFRNLLNPLVAAQNFEYKMSNILDKPLESVFGYITVLPGAFSAYRYIALQNDAKGEGPLREYFKGETLHHQSNADLWTKNMYLAEDRILCWELVSKRNSAWLLHYQRSAYAVTDVPDTVPDLISQRRRWLNGSFFAGLHSSVHFGRIYRSDHSFIRKAWLHVELVYQLFNMLFAWFALGNYYIIFSILTSSMADPSFGLTGISIFNTVLTYYYIALLIMCFLLAMGNRPQGSAKMFTFMMVSFAGITVYMLAAAGFITAKGIINVKNAVEAGGKTFTVADIFANAIFRNIVLSLLATYGLYLISSIIFFDPAHMFTSFLQYMLLAPSYINVINVYAFCNVQDVTWGNRPEEAPTQDLGVVKSTGTKDGTVDVSLPTDEKDINAAYDDACHVLSEKAPKSVEKRDPETEMTDSYRSIRTNVVLAWSLSNGALVAGILSTAAGSNITASGGSTTVNGYMTFLLFSVAGLALVRFVGCFVYTVFWVFQR